MMTDFLFVEEVNDVFSTSILLTVEKLGISDMEKELLLLVAKVAWLYNHILDMMKKFNLNAI